MFPAVSTIRSKLLVIDSTNEVTIETAIFIIIGTYFIKELRIFGKTESITLVILVKSPLQSFMPLVSSDKYPTPSVAKSVRIGSNIVPSAFLRAVAPTVKYCI